MSFNCSLGLYKVQGLIYLNKKERKYADISYGIRKIFNDVLPEEVKTCVNKFIMNELDLHKKYYDSKNLLDNRSKN